MSTTKWDASRFSVTSNQPSREEDARASASRAGMPPATGVRSTDNLATDDIVDTDTVTPRGGPTGSTRRTVSPGSRDITDTTDAGGMRSSGFRRDLEDDRSQAASDYWDDRSGPGPQVMTADTLTGDKVVNEEGETLGEISDIMIDVPTGRVAYAVLSVGGLLGVGEKLFAIPWRALQLDTEHKRFVLAVAKDKLETAPGFDKDHWPSMADETWANEVHSYYGSQPYWE